MSSESLPSLLRPFICTYCTVCFGSAIGGASWPHQACANSPSVSCRLWPRVSGRKIHKNTKPAADKMPYSHSVPENKNVIQKYTAYQTELIRLCMGLFFNSQKNALLTIRSQILLHRMVSEGNKEVKEPAGTSSHCNGSTPCPHWVYFCVHSPSHWTQTCKNRN